MIDANGQIRVWVPLWVERLVEKGYVALLVDSFNPRGHKEVCTQMVRPILEDRERPLDAYGGLQCLLLPCVANDRVFLMGFTHGATGSLYALNDSGSRLRAAKRTGIRFAAALAFNPGCTAANRNGLKAAVPLAIFIGAADDWTPAAPCESLISSAKSAGREAEIFQLRAHTTALTCQAARYDCVPTCAIAPTRNWQPVCMLAATTPRGWRR